MPFCSGAGGSFLASFLACRLRQIHRLPKLKIATEPSPINSQSAVRFIFAKLWTLVS